MNREKNLENKGIMVENASIIVAIVIILLVGALMIETSINKMTLAFDSAIASKDTIIESDEKENAQLRAEIDKLEQKNQELETYISELEETINEQKVKEQDYVQNQVDQTLKRYYAQPALMTSRVRIVSLTDIPNEIDVSKSTTVSGLSGNDFNELIDVIAEHRGIDDCVFTGTGETFETVETEFGINGLYLLTIFTNESGFGENNVRANNAAGIKIGGEYTSFDSINDCILYLGELLKTYDDNYNRDTFSEIGERYCPGNQDWIDSNVEVCNLYADFAYKNIYEST